MGDQPFVNYVIMLVVKNLSNLLIILSLTGCATSDIHQRHSFVYGCINGLLWEQTKQYEIYGTMPSTRYNREICEGIEQHYIRNLNPEEKEDGAI
jgi:hypothetical protein